MSTPCVCSLSWRLRSPRCRPAWRSGGREAVRLLHVGPVVRDERAAHAFYRDALGFSEIWRGGRPEGVTSWVNMRVPDGSDQARASS